MLDLGSWKKVKESDPKALTFPRGNEFWGIRATPDSKCVYNLSAGCYKLQRLTRENHHQILASF